MSRSSPDPEPEPFSPREVLTLLWVLIIFAALAVEAVQLLLSLHL